MIGKESDVRMPGQNLDQLNLNGPTRGISGMQNAGSRVTAFADQGQFTVRSTVEGNAHFFQQNFFNQIGAFLGQDSYCFRITMTCTGSIYSGLGSPEQRPPAVFSLNAPSPNPFNPSVRFSIDMPSAEHLAVRIFDLKGRRVREIWDGDIGVGHHEMAWHGRMQSGQRAPSGIYFVRAVSRYGVQVRKITLAK